MALIRHLFHMQLKELNSYGRKKKMFKVPGSAVSEYEHTNNYITHIHGEPHFALERKKYTDYRF